MYFVLKLREKVKITNKNHIENGALVILSARIEAFNPQKKGA